MTTIDAAYRILSEEEGAEPDVFIGRDDLASPRPTSASGGSSGLQLAELVRNPGMSVTQAAFIAAPAVFGYGLGTTPVQRALYAALGAALGALAYEGAAGQGWID